MGIKGLDVVGAEHQCQLPGDLLPPGYISGVWICPECGRHWQFVSPKGGDNPGWTYFTNQAEQRQYPYASGDVTVIGPECFTGMSDEGKVISYKGENYYRR